MSKTPAAFRKSAFGRTNLFLPTASAVFKEVRCSVSSSTRHASTSIFHPHSGNNAVTKPEGCVCWHCCHSFDSPPFRVPRIVDLCENVYHVYGWFCSANCGKAYILEHSTFDKGYQLNIFVRMLRDVYNISEQVNEAPPRHALQMFGGPFNIETFRTVKNICLPVTPPFVSYSMLIEERQPLPSMGESVSSGSSAKCSVRNLKRPTVRNVVETPEVVGSPKESLYASYLEAHARKDMQDEASTSTSTAKKAKVSKPKAEGGLARFACS